MSDPKPVISDEEILAGCENGTMTIEGNESALYIFGREALITHVRRLLAKFAERVEKEIENAEERTSNDYDCGGPLDNNDICRDCNASSRSMSSAGIVTACIDCALEKCWHFTDCICGCHRGRP